MSRWLRVVLPAVCLVPSVGVGQVPSPPCVACEAPGGFDFKKVPPAPRPLVRPGMFSIPPSGPGYYSLLDAVNREEREAAPKYPYPPFTTSTLSFFDADWRFVDDPKYTPDALEKLKRIRLGENVLLSTGGQAWFRYANEANARLGQRDDQYTLYRVRPYFDLWYQDRFRLFAEFIAADSFNHNLPPRNNDVDRADFQNLFVEARVGEVMDKPVFARVGRQEVQLGSQRLIATPDWANTRRTFEGARIFRVGEKWDVDLFYLRPLFPNANRLNSSDNNQNFAGAWATYKPKKGTTWDMYYLLLDDTNRVRQQGVNRTPETIHTLGSRFAGDYAAEYLWDVEGAIQLGERDGNRVFAGMFTAAVGYHSKTLPWNPTLWMSYDYASGDRNPNDGTAHTFQQLFPFGHYYFGWLDFVGRQNIHDLSTSLHLYPAKWLTIWTQYHVFALDQSRDALYNVGGAAIRRDPTGRAGNFVGSEIDLIFNIHLTKRADLLTGYSHFFGGNFLRNTQGANAARDADLYYLSYSYRW